MGRYIKHPKRNIKNALILGLCVVAGAGLRTVFDQEDPCPITEDFSGVSCHFEKILSETSKISLADPDITQIVAEALEIMIDEISEYSGTYPTIDTSALRSEKDIIDMFRIIPVLFGESDLDDDRYVYFGQRAINGLLRKFDMHASSNSDDNETYETDFEVRLIGGNIGYIQLENFGTNSDEVVSNAIRFLQDTGGDDMKGFVLDLRGNPGGYVTEAINIADAFLDAGLIVTEKFKTEEREFSATSGDLTNGLPVIILVDHNTASASELVAGALQDHGRARLLGTRTYGKGVGQQTIDIGNGHSLKMTSFFLLTPSGDSVQKRGLIPDILFQPLEPDTTRQRRMEDFRNTPDNPNLGEDFNETTATCTPRENARIPRSYTAHDYQHPDFALICAIENLTGEAISTNTTPISINMEIS